MTSMHEYDPDALEKKKPWLEAICKVYTAACPCLLVETSQREQHAIDSWWAETLPERSALPEKLRGVFFMNGNQPENCVTFEHAKFDPEAKRIILRVDNPMNWTTQNDRTLQTVNWCCLEYDFRFNKEYTHADIIPWICKLPLLPFCIKFTMEEHLSKTNGNGNVYFRRSSACCGKYSELSYTLQKVISIDSEGNKARVTQYYKEMTERTKKVCYVVPGTPEVQPVAPIENGMSR